MKTNDCLMQAIEVFEKEIERIREEYSRLNFDGGTLDVASVANRDDDLAHCLFGIELLHSAYLLKQEATYRRWSLLSEQTVTTKREQTAAHGN